MCPSIDLRIGCGVPFFLPWAQAGHRYDEQRVGDVVAYRVADRRNRAFDVIGSGGSRDGPGGVHSPPRDPRMCVLRPRLGPSKRRAARGRSYDSVADSRKLLPCLLPALDDFLRRAAVRRPARTISTPASRNCMRFRCRRRDSGRAPDAGATQALGAPVVAVLRAASVDGGVCAVSMKDTHASIRRPLPASCIRPSAAGKSSRRTSACP